MSSVFGVDQLVRHVENGLLEIFRLVCGSSAQAPSCWRERRRQTSWAAAAMPLGRVAACVTSLHYSLLALLNPSMALGSFSLSLLMQVHEAAAVVASGGDAGAEWRPSTQPVIERLWRTRDRVPRCQGWGWATPS